MSFISPIPTDASGNQRQTGSLQQLGKNDFLQLLITKLQNQDPLKPMEDEDFIAQLAQFSSLEQMNNIAEGISTSNQWDFLQMQSLNNVMASGLIGKEVMAEYDGIYVDHQSTNTVNYSLDSPADEVRFVVRSEDGSIVATITRDNVQAGSHSFGWDGTDNLGNQVEEGYYTIEATATSTSGATFTPDLSLVGLVESVIYRDGSAYLRVNGTEIALGDIAAVGEPGSMTGKSDD